MCNKEQIIENLCYTELVYGRINKKLGLTYTKDEIEELILNVLSECNESCYSRVGKNYYISNKDRNIRVTINSNTFRVITVDKLKNKNRAIHLFPEFEGLDLIQDIRVKYDPLYTKIQPHITLVFPFFSEITTAELEEHLKQVLDGERCFDIELQNIRAVESHGYYLFLDIIKGEESIKHLHNKLYKGILESVKPTWLDPDLYTPHITVGNFDNRELMLEAEKTCRSVNKKFSSKISKVWVEEIDRNDNSIIEFVINLD